MENKQSFKTSIGGQALIEGLLMKGPEKTCIAVRRPDGEIYTEISNTPKSKFKKIPLVRGVAMMVENLIYGYKSLMRSADLSMNSELMEDTKFDKWLKAKFGDRVFDSVSVVGGVLGALLSIALFMVLPTAITGGLSKILPIEGAKAVIEGVLKIAIFIGYLFLVTRMEDIHRVFEYHGAEHKTIACYEAGEELNVENVKKYTRFHPRCGTSFIFIVLIVSIAVASLIPWTNTALRVVYKLLLLPVVMGVSYEILRYSGRHDNALSRALSAPGRMIQRLTAFEPDDEQIEVAIAAMNEVLPQTAGEDRW